MDESKVKLKQLSEKQLDYLLVFLDVDYDRVSAFNDRLLKSGLGLDGRLYNDPTPFESWILQDETERIQDLTERSTYIFFCVTNSFGGKGAASTNFQHHKNEAILKNIRRGNKNVIPIWLDPKNDLTKEAERPLYGLMSILGLDPNSHYFDTHLKRLIESDGFKTSKETREREQREELAHHQIMHDQQQLEAEKEEQELQKHGKSAQILKKNGHVKANGVTNNYNVTINNAKNVHVGDRVIQNGDVSDQTPADCVTATADFWSDFSHSDGTDVHESMEESASYQESSDSSFGRDLQIDGGPCSQVNGTNTGPMSAISVCSN